ncbi:hypothetical protein D3C87_1939160 [compost metagenome]
MIADHFELDPVRLENLARHLGSENGFLGGMAAGRVRQYPRPERADQFEKRTSRFAAGCFSP